VQKDLPREMKQQGQMEDAQSARKSVSLLGKRIVPGINLAAGFSLLQDDTNSYLSVLRSYAKNTPAKINAIKTAGDDLDSYRIAIHAIKGSSKIIGAETLGEQAEMLEEAAVNGDRGYIRANNLIIVEDLEKLVADIGLFLAAVSKNDPEGENPERECPDPELLREILRACDDYDILALQKAVKSLASFRYVVLPDLAQWIAEQSHLSNFDAIQARITSLMKIVQGGQVKNESLPCQ